jgi:hypothetical protein
MVTKTSLDDPFLPLAFSLYSNPGAYAVLAGAGISRGAGLPTTWDIVVDLIAQMADDEEIDSDTAGDWYEKRYGRQPTYSDVVHQLALTQTERQTLLRKYFDNTADRAEEMTPSVAHRAVARMMRAGTIRVVLTVNFDRLFEQALQELGIEPTVVATEADAQGVAPLHTLQHCIIHLHGDYLNAVSMRNTAAELARYPRHMKALLRHVVIDYGLLVAGWSVEYDPALRESVAAHYPSRFTMAWVNPGALGPAAISLTEAKKAQVLHTTADDAASGTVRLIHLPLVAATLLFYGAGIAAVAAERFDLLRRLFQLRVNTVGQTPRAASEILLPTTAVENRYRQLYEQILNVVGDALGLDAQPVDQALQLFEILRLSTQVAESNGFDALIREYATATNAVVDAPSVEAGLPAWRARQSVIGQAAERISAYHTHLFAAERQYEAGRGRRWSSPIAERLADEVLRQGEFHPVVAGLQLGVTGAQLAVKAVGAAVGAVARTLEWQATPIGRAGFIPDEFWLDGPNN